MGASSWVHLDVDRVVRLTEKAMLVEIDGEEVWVPLSVVADAETYEEGDTDVTISIQEWWAEKNDLGG